MRKLLFLILFIKFNLFGQDFKIDIQKFKQLDSISFPQKNAILFIGSSSFTNWKDVQEYFPSHKIINRGFGGSSLPDLINYQNDIIYPYEPKQIVIYCGENDIAGDSLVGGKVVLKRFIKLFKSIRKKLPNTNISFVSMKPSPSRFHLFDKVKQGNMLIERFLSKHKNASYIDVFSQMLTNEGLPDQSLFLEDMLHMKKNGYEIWQRIIESYLVK